MSDKLTLVLTDVVLSRPWRVGRKLGRTIYAVVGTDPDDSDVLLGLVETPALAAHIVDAHNERLWDGRRNPESTTP